ncbi:hypothetical protein MTO96_028823 [Rhipicephalus appendiculatus]
MPARHAKPTGGAERGTPAASSRPKRSASMAEIPTDNDPQQAQDPMDTADQDTETQATSVADAEEDFLSPDEVTQGTSTSDDDDEKDSAREDATNGQWQVALSLRERKRLRKQKRAVSDHSGARGVGEGNSCDARTPAGEQAKRGGTVCTSSTENARGAAPQKRHKHHHAAQTRSSCERT